MDETPIQPLSQPFDATQGKPSIQPAPAKPLFKFPLILLIVAGLAVAGYFASTYYFQLYPFEVSLTPVPTFTPRPSSVVKVEDVSNWKTYTDNAVGVSLQYPEDWYVVSPAGLPGFFWLSNVSRDDQFNRDKMNTDAVKNASDFRVELRAFDNTLSIDQWYDKYFSSNPLQGIVLKTQTTIAGLSAIQVITKYNYTGSGPQYTVNHYFVAKGSHVIEINFGTDQNQVQYLNIYNLILANIKFFQITIPVGSYKISKNNVFSQSINAEDIYAEEGFNYGSNEVLMPGGNSVNGEAVLTLDGVYYIIPHSIAEKIGGLTGAIENPQNKDVVFISGSNFSIAGSDLSSCINKLYTYNIKTGELVEFYSEVSKNNSPMGSNSCRILRIQGMQGPKLIVRTDDPDNSPGPCTDIWASFKDQMLYIDLADIQSGLKKFIVPQNVINNGIQSEQECQVSL